MFNRLVIGSIAPVALVVFFLTSAAQAQWRFKAEDDPFGDNHLHAAYIVKDHHSLGVRCIGGARLTLLFNPDYKAKQNLIDQINMIRAPHILLRIDDQPVKKIPATILKRKGYMLAGAVLPPSLAQQIANSRKRVAAALLVGSTRIGTISFGVQNSGNTITRVLRTCKQVKKKNR
jgi:hypothetical protein